MSFRVICVDDNNQNSDSIPKVKRGNIYHVVAEENIKGKPQGKLYIVPGLYYTLAECGGNALYHSSLFIKINELEIDETQYSTIKEKEKV